MFGNNNNNNGNASSTEAAIEAANAAVNEAANEAVIEAVNEAVNEAANAEATFGTAAALPALNEAAMGKKGKGKGTGKSRGPLSVTQKAALKTGRNQAKTKKNADLATKKKLFGRFIYPGETGKEATDLDLKMLDDIAKERILAGKLPDIAADIEELIKRKKDMPEKRAKVTYSPNTKATRQEIRKTLRGFKINPSAARVNAYTKRKANFASLNKTNAANRKTLMNYFLAEKAFSPKLEGRRKEKADAKAALAAAKNAAEESLLKVATERTVKGEKKKTVNPATVKHFAELRLAGYKIEPKEIVDLSSLVKKAIKPEQKAAIAVNPIIMRLKKHAKDNKFDACKRCLLTTIFGVPMA